MVKKLFKHEFLFYIRVMGIVYGILLTMALAGRIILCFESDSISYRIVSTISGITYGISVFATLAFTVVLAIVRFYKNLFTAEGYLTFTLPVTPTQHILVKAVTALTMEVITVVAILLSGCVIFAGEVLVEIWKAGAYILGKVYEQVGFQMVLIGSEIILLLLLASLSGILMYYVFISIGQLFKKNRILAAVGAYFVYYIIMQIISTVSMVIFTIVVQTAAFEKFAIRLGDFVTKHPYAAIHSGMGIYLLLAAAFVFVEFIVVKKITTKRLNLE